MHIWRTTRLVPGTCYMNARLVSLWWVGLTMLPQKTLASFLICSFLFRCAHEFLWFWTRRQLIEIFHISPLRKNSGSMQFVERRKGVHNRQEDLSLFAKFQYNELIWCLVVFEHDFHSQCLAQVKTRREGKTRGDGESRLLWVSIVKTKDQSLRLALLPCDSSLTPT